MTLQDKDRQWMEEALELAKQAGDRGEVPVGALIVFDGEIVGKGSNQREGDKVATHHAEVLAIEAACRRLNRWRLIGCTLYVTLEPCVMCCGAIIISRIERVVYGASDPKGGAASSLYSILSDSRLNHQPEVLNGVCADLCGQLLSQFFRSRRGQK